MNNSLAFKKRPLLVNSPLVDWLPEPEEDYEEGAPLTVCVAAIAGNGRIYCAADRMKTVGNVTYEPDTAKIYTLVKGGRIAGMLSGTVHWNTEMMQRVAATINAMESSGEKISVLDACHLWIGAYNALLGEKIELEVLGKYGVTLDEIKADPPHLNSTFITNVMREIQDHKPPTLGCIITGFDLEEGGATVSHLYQISNGKVVNCDESAYCAIGSGAEHARSVFVQRRHNTKTSEHETIWRVYLAKRRAEVAPGVGKVFDIACINPASRKMLRLNSDETDLLDDVYAKFLKEESSMYVEAENTVLDKYLRRAGLNKSQNNT